MTEKIKQTETKTTEVGLIKAKPKFKEEKALQTFTKSEKKGKQYEDETDEDLKKVVEKEEKEGSQNWQGPKSTHEKEKSKTNSS